MQDYANSLLFTNSLFCSFENLMIKYTFCVNIKSHIFTTGAFIPNLKIVKVPFELNLVRKTSLTSVREI